MNTLEKNTVDIIIPALNEEKILKKTLPKLVSIIAKNSELEFRTILADNGSSDHSVEIARFFGIEIISHPKATISYLRNIATKNTNGSFLIFIDADIEVTEGWIIAVSNFIKRYDKNSLVISGYPYSYSDDNVCWIVKHWFNNKGASKKYINSGNIITTRAAFNKLGGFDETIETGEDYDFCSRAKSLGVAIVLDPEFLVYHHGFPSILKQFYYRELWHGMGDCKTLKRYLASMPSVVSATFTITALTGVMLILIGKPTSGFILLLLNLIKIFYLASKKTTKCWHYPGNCLIASVYFIARFSSPIKKALSVWLPILFQKDMHWR